MQGIGAWITRPWQATNRKTDRLTELGLKPHFSMQIKTSLRHLLQILTGLSICLVDIDLRADVDDWPSYRRDGALSAYSPLKGNLAVAPRLLWSVDLGAKTFPAETVRVEDVNGDGLDEILRITKDALICLSISGTSLWRLPGLRSPSILQIRDFAGDGSQGLLLEEDTGTEIRTSIVDGKSGVQTELCRRRNVFGLRHRFGKILPKVRGQQFCHWWDGQDNELTGPIAHGYLWSFEDGLTRPRRRFQVDVAGVIYSAQHLFADMDRDGREDLIMVSQEQIWIYDLETGRQKSYARWDPSIRSYSSAMALVALRPGDLPSLLLINPHIPGFEVLHWDGTNIHKAWRQVVGLEESQYQQQVQLQGATPDPFIDLDGDGRIEILAQITNEQNDGKSHFVLVDALSGKRLFDQPDLQVRAVDDLDGDGRPELLLKDQLAWRIASWDGQRFRDRWQSTNAAPEFDSHACDPGLARGVGGNSGCNPTLLRGPNHRAEFILALATERWICRLLPGGGLEKVRPANGSESGNASTLLATNRLSWKWDGTTLVTQSNEIRLFRHTIAAKPVYMAPPALVGTLNGQRRIIARTASGSLLSITTDGQNTQTILHNTPGFTQADGLYYTHLGTASLCDLDGDGANEVLASVRQPDGSPCVVAVNGMGEIQKRFQPPADTTQLALGPNGTLGRGKGRWFVARCVRKFGRDTVVAFDGQTGNQLWLRDEFNPPGRTTKFVLHIPSAVLDYDRDGTDDLIALSENFYGILSVRDNRVLVEPFDLTTSLRGHWPAFSTPLLVPQPGNLPPKVFLSRAYAVNYLVDLEGNPIWHWGASRDTTPRNHASLADLDGNGSVEIVTAQADGTLTAFDAEPASKKCPICPSSDAPSHRNRAAHIRWSFQIPSPVGGMPGHNQNSDQDFASADLDGDGQIEILLGGGDGKLYALKDVRGSCSVLWSLDLASRVGSPILSDLNGDGTPEILVPTEDGRLHCLGKPLNP